VARGAALGIALAGANLGWSLGHNDAYRAPCCAPSASPTRGRFQEEPDRHRLDLGMVTPCNMHIDQLAPTRLGEGADAAGGKA
jgi:hypothetical protein